MTTRDYVVQTHPCHEALAHGNLLAAGFASYLPTVLYEGRTGRRREQRYTTMEPLFPGYLFVTFDLASPRWRTINGIRGVRRILSQDSEHPTPLAVDTLNELGARYAAGEFVRNATYGISAGDAVIVSSGAFQGHTGVCTVSRGDRIRVLLNLLWGALEVNLPAAMAARAGA